MNHPIEKERARLTPQSTTLPQPTTAADHLIFVTLARLGYIVTTTDQYTRLIRKAAA